MKHDMDWLLRQAYDSEFHSEEIPDSVLNQKILQRAAKEERVRKSGGRADKGRQGRACENKWKENYVKWRKPSLAAVIVMMMLAVLLPSGIKAFQSMLTPEKIVDFMGNMDRIREFFDEPVTEINQVQELGEYTVTLVGTLMEEEKENPAYKKWAEWKYPDAYEGDEKENPESVPEGRLYAFFKIEKTDGTNLSLEEANNHFECGGYVKEADNYELLDRFSSIQRIWLDIWRTGEVVTQIKEVNETYSCLEDGVLYLIVCGESFDEEGFWESYRKKGVYLGIMISDSSYAGEAQRKDTADTEESFQGTGRYYLYRADKKAIYEKFLSGRECVMFELPFDTEAGAEEER